MRLRHTPHRNGRLFGLAVLLFLVAGLLNECAADSQDEGRVPTKDEQAKTLKLVREIYHAEYKAAQTSRQKSALAQKILKAGEETDDPSGVDKKGAGVSKWLPFLGNKSGT